MIHSPRFFTRARHRVGETRPPLPVLFRDGRVRVRVLLPDEPGFRLLELGVCQGALLVQGVQLG